MRNKKLRILISKETSTSKNLAIEESILELLNKGKTLNTFRLWKNKESAILAINEKAYEAIDLDFCFSNNIDINRRITGGGAVYHDEGNLNWSFFFEKKLFKKLSIVELYKFFSNFIIKSLKKLSINAKFYEPNWIGIDNKKISGMAGYVKRNAILIHGTLLIDSNLYNLEKVCKFHYKYPKTLNLSNIKKISFEDVLNSILETVNKEYDCFISKISKDEEDFALFLDKKKYKTLSWIFKE